MSLAVCCRPALSVGGPWHSVERGRAPNFRYIALVGRDLSRIAQHLPSGLRQSLDQLRQQLTVPKPTRQLTRRRGDARDHIIATRSWCTAHRLPGRHHFVLRPNSILR